MALHMLRSTPSFTVTLRGYDKDEVDEYIDSLRDSHDGDAEALADADSRSQFLESEVRRMTGRVGDLERALRSETPRSIDALGERLVLILDQAEAGATETVAVAENEASGIMAAARQAAEEARVEAARVMSDAQARAANTTKTAEQTAWRLEHEAQQRADEVVRQAEAQAEARITEIEQWAAQVRAQITSDQVHAREEFARVKGIRDEEIRELIGRRDAIIAGLDAVSRALVHTISDAHQVTGYRPGEEPQATDADVPYDADTADTADDAMGYERPTEGASIIEMLPRAGAGSTVEADDDTEAAGVADPGATDDSVTDDGATDDGVGEHSMSGGVDVDSDAGAIDEDGGAMTDDDSPRSSTVIAYDHEADQSH